MLRNSVGPRPWECEDIFCQGQTSERQTPTSINNSLSTTMRTSFSSQCQCTHMALAAVFSSMMISAHALPLGDLAPLNGGLARNELMESSFRETAFHEGRRSRSLPMDPDTYVVSFLLHRQSLTLSCSLDSVLQDLSHLSSSPTSVLQHDVTIPSVAALVECKLFQTSSSPPNPHGLRF